MANLDGRISRRTLLRGAGAMMALPFLEAMLPTRVSAAGAAAQPPKRFAVFSVTSPTSGKFLSAVAFTTSPSSTRDLFSYFFFVASGRAAVASAFGVSW